MNTRFSLLIIMLIALFSAWLYHGYEHAISHQAKLDDIARLPVYAYVADTTKVSLIKADLGSIPGIKSIVHETAEQAATELLNAYALPLNEEMIADYSFPDIVTINFAASKLGLESKPMVIDILRSHLPEEDIDSQASAYAIRSADLQVINRRTIAFHVFAALLMLLIFVFSRLSFELHTLLLYKGKRHSVVDEIRHHKQGVQHTWAMLLIPLPVCIIGYFAFVFIKPVPQLVPYWVFAAQFAAAFVGTLITHFSLHTFEQEVAFDEAPIIVVNPPEPTLKEEGTDEETHS